MVRRDPMEEHGSPSSLAGGTGWLQSLTPRGCQSHANLHRRPTLREQLFDKKLNPQLLILLVSSDCVDLPGPYPVVFHRSTSRSPSVDRLGNRQAIRGERRRITNLLVLKQLHAPSA
ncbi:hypothetical protein FOCG_03823 [Fusarium oxysporum f. sp. radicis-lycopersici 26381]|uniref:Uncharacterized protein n=1 Tax=Fusarium oxysporum Fo47 TaxID=660027 RepID=W9K5H9_FUSOX|nr:hypothetical protein FOZG_10643 [Fusarium oxysporum Fo47]EWZ90668.1 hypothetical protein FOWG_08262 [Fusarium oxysporum f. sp. lycopersici MN25]EXL56129.1 hypothetical protein FOCG_03823 [Fusarium oxysporum f. sp. radicis-lycopersici 26381]